MVASNRFEESPMFRSHDDQLPPTFNRLAWSNLAAVGRADRAGRGADRRGAG
jgi:hypothetical protein